MAKNITDSLNIALESIVIALLNDPEVNNSKLESLKRKAAREYNLGRFVRNSEIIEFIESTDILTDSDKEALRLFGWDYVCFQTQIAIDYAAYYYTEGEDPKYLESFTEYRVNPFNRD